jgi:hypothetical protein
MATTTPSTSRPWTCPTCHRTVVTRYCPECGERSPSASDLTLLLICAVYLYVAIGAVYGTRRGVRIVHVALLAFAVACLVLGYRFVLLPITLYTT